MNIDCLSHEESYAFIKDQFLYIDIISTHLQVDFEAADNYITTKLEHNGYVSLSSQGGFIYQPLTVVINQLSMQDSVVDPFEATTDEREFFNLELG